MKTEINTHECVYLNICFGRKCDNRNCPNKMCPYKKDYKKCPYSRCLEDNESKTQINKRKRKM